MNATKSIPLLPILFFIGITLQAQNYKKAYKQLSKSEKCWVIFHPFKAKKAYRISLQVEKTVDSIARTDLLDSDRHGGKLDAFKHCYWMFSLAQEVGYRAARSLGKAHEKGNYKQFKKQLLEAPVMQDSIASAMDQYNNLIGIQLFKAHPNAEKFERIQLILAAIDNRQLKIIRKNKNGDYLNCQNDIISLKNYAKTWNIPKCLIFIE